MTARPADLAILLPPSESFQAANAGAISLSVRDFVRFSGYADRTTVFGARVDEPFAGIRFRGLATRGLAGSRRLAYLLSATRALLTARPKLIEVHNRPEFLPWLMRVAPGAGFALFLHNDPQAMRRFRSAGERRALLARLDTVFCVSGHIRSRLLEGIDDPALARKAVVCPIGFDLPVFDARRAVIAAPRDPVVLFVGRIVQDKGADLFVEAAAAALADRPGWRAVMVGADRPPEGATARAAAVSPFEAAVRARVAAINAGRDRPLIEMTGFRTYDQVLDLYGRAAMAVVPSVWDEPFGRTAVEAMAMGCPLIATERGGLRDIVHGAGLTLDPATPDALAAAIGALADDPARREALARNGRAHLDRQGYDIRDVAAGMDRARRDRLGQPVSAPPVSTSGNPPRPPLTQRTDDA
ncbi:glycosyltransferase family 4 protein [Tistrella mobilis]|uniref:glycosyltransferase family 4 protein n=1 Tax=Tistrella mobilis TaxID=171437 RepID=UPI003558B723